MTKDVRQGGRPVAVPPPGGRPIRAGHRRPPRPAAGHRSGSPVFARALAQGPAPVGPYPGMASPASRQGECRSGSEAGQGAWHAGTGTGPGLEPSSRRAAWEVGDRSIGAGVKRPRCRVAVLPSALVRFCVVPTAWF